MDLKYKNIINELTVEEKASLMSGKDFWQTQNIDRLNIKTIFLADGPHGVRKQAGASDNLGINGSIKATCFPTASAMANTFNLELAKKMATYLGKEAKSQNVNILLGPGMNIKRNPLCGRNFEYFSEDPYLAGKMASSYVQGIQSNGISACLKHFACNNQETKRMVLDSIVDERALREIYLTGFEIAVKEAKPMSIMTSYNRLNGTYTNENMHLLQEILRGEWGYDGFVVTDWGGSNKRISGLECTNALEMPTTKGETDLEIVNAIKNNSLDEEILNQRVNEILSIIDKTKINEKVEIDVNEHHEMAKLCALESIVLLKNNESLLPLNNKDKVAFIGDFFNKPRYQGAGSSIVNPTKLDTVKEIINEYNLNYIGYEKGYNRFGKKNKMLFNKAIKLANNSDVIVYAMGLDEVSEAEGVDRKNIDLNNNQIELLKELSKLNKKIVVTLFSGSTIDLSFDVHCDALVHAYLLGQAGALALLDILVGKVSPSGRLSESYPNSYSDISTSFSFPEPSNISLYKESIYVGYRYLNLDVNRVRYPFGYGLSYSSFSYSDLKVLDNGVSLKVKNIGNYNASEVIQLYISKKDSKVYRTAPELKGFTKVYLEINEEKEVFIPFDEYSFRYFDVNTNKFEIEEGEYDILIGKNSLDFILKDVIYKEGTVITKELKYDYSLNTLDEEFIKLLNREVDNIKIEYSKKNKIHVDYNTTVFELKYAKGFLGRLFEGVIRLVVKFLMFINKPLVANNIIMGVYNNPVRALSRMSGGMISFIQLDALITMFNGEFFKGLKEFFKASKTKFRKGDK